MPCGHTYRRPGIPWSILAASFISFHSSHIGILHQKQVPSSSHHHPKPNLWTLGMVYGGKSGPWGNTITNEPQPTAQCNRDVRLAGDRTYLFPGVINPERVPDGWFNQLCPCVWCVSCTSPSDIVAMFCELKSNRYSFDIILENPSKQQVDKSCCNYAS